MKKIPFVLIILGLFVCSLHAYTVVLKNGKTMEGTLVSESEQAIVFKDSGGIQYSLKKSSLDLDKMAQANIAPPEPPKEETIAPEPPPPPPKTETSAKKKGRTYTQKDLDKLREKYTDLSTGEPIENLEDYDEAGLMKSDAYLRYLREGSTRIDAALSDIVLVRDTVATNWEVAAGTGKDPDEVIAEYLAKPETAEIVKKAARELDSVRMMIGRVAQYPEEYREAFELFNQSLTSATDYLQSVTNYKTMDNVNLYRSRLTDTENVIKSNTTRLQSWTPPEKKEAKPVPDNNETEEESETDESSNTESESSEM